LADDRSATMRTQNTISDYSSENIATEDNATGSKDFEDSEQKRTKE